MELLKKISDTLDSIKILLEETNSILKSKIEAEPYGAEELCNKIRDMLDTKS